MSAVSETVYLLDDGDQGRRRRGSLEDAVIAVLADGRASWPTRR